MFLPKISSIFLFLLPFSLLLAFCITFCSDDDDDTTPTPTAVTSPTPTETPGAEQGTLHIWTTPIAGEIFLNGESVGNGDWTQSVDIGIYTVSFGDVSGYFTPDQRAVEVFTDQTSDVQGVYVEYCSFVDVCVNGEAYDGGTVYIPAAGQPAVATITFTQVNGIYWQATAENGTVDPTSGYPGPNTITFMGSGSGCGGVEATVQIDGYVEGDRLSCYQTIKFFIDYQ
ncbi:hypothetical protein JXQ70_16725 [bacterium]|nr:hypothetical protein [bacterium]